MKMEKLNKDTGLIYKMFSSKSKIFYMLSALLFICFVVFIVVDYINYNSILTSFPFYTNIIVRSIEFILPSIICLLVGAILKKRDK